MRLGVGIMIMPRARRTWMLTTRNMGRRWKTNPTGRRRITTLTRRGNSLDCRATKLAVFLLFAFALVQIVTFVGNNTAVFKDNNQLP